MKIVLILIGSTIVLFIVWLNMILGNKMRNYQIREMDGRLILSRLLFLIESPKTFRLNDIKSIEFDIRYNIPYQATIFENSNFTFSIDENQLSKLEKISYELNIETRYIEDRGFISR